MSSLSLGFIDVEASLISWCSLTSWLYSISSFILHCDCFAGLVFRCEEKLISMQKEQGIYHPYTYKLFAEIVSIVWPIYIAGG